MRYGFIKVAAAVPELKVAACSYNTNKIIEMIRDAENAGVEIVLFPELSITAYTCGDLLQQERLLKAALEGLLRIAEATKGLKTIVIAGLPLLLDNQLFNCAVVIQGGVILGIVPKTYIPGYSEFNEERWFASARNAHSQFVELFGRKVPFGTDLLFGSRIADICGQSSMVAFGDQNNMFSAAASNTIAGVSGTTASNTATESSEMTESYTTVQVSGMELHSTDNFCFGVEICEDLWTPVPPSSYLAAAGAAVIFNLSASNEYIGKAEYRRELVRQQSRKCISGYVYVSSGVHESTGDVVFGGHSLITENGGVLCESERFLRRGNMIISEIDVQRLLNNRIKNTSFMDGVSDHSFRRIPFTLYNGPEAKGTDCNFKLTRHVDPYPFVPSDIQERNRRCEEIFAIQTAGLAKRLEHTGIKKAVIGVSGGLDSTLALIVTAKTLDLLGIPRENILAITMPGFGTTDTTYENALQLIKSFGAELREIDIKKACLQHFENIGHDPSVHDITYENVQARERTQILMDTANKLEGLVIGTGDLSELALGWCTYNGDHMSMYSVNCGVPKTLIRHLVQWAADNMDDKAAAAVMLRILDTPISPELLPPDAKGKIKQKTEDVVGPYELHDFFLYHMIRYGASPKKVLYLADHAFDGKYDIKAINLWLKLFIKRFFSQQFKRSCLPDGPKVGTVSLSPRGDWRMPSDATAEDWLNELE